MVCKICGKQLPDGSSVCKYCGAKQRNPGTGSSPTRRYSKKGLARRRMINTALLGIIALLIVGILAGIVMSARSAGENNDDAQLSANEETNENNENNENPETEEPVVTPDEETEEPTEEEPEETDEPEEEQEEDPDAESEEPEETDEPEDSEEPDESEDPEVTDEPEESDEPEEEPEEEPTETPDETPEETPEPPVVIPTGNYTASINRTSVEASLNHYRILTVAINETLPAGVEVASVSFTSSNDAIVRTEVVDGEGRAWGVALGKATVTGTVTLSTGETASTTCEVTVVEYKEPPKETKPSGSSSSSSSSSYILSDSSSRVYSVSELNKLSDKQLRLARNEIYARHGRIFKDAELKAYFESKSWYKGTISPDKFDDSLLNATEKKNITNIQKAESN